MKKKNPLGIFAKCVALGLVIGGVIGFTVPFTSGYIIPKAEEAIRESAGSLQHDGAPQDENSENVINAAATASLDEASKNTIELIKRVKPSIACITTKTTAQSWFYQTYEAEGAGSGVIFHEDEENVYIATNAHVISGATRVMVSISESDLVEAELVGKDANADLAVISVSKTALNSVGITGVTVAQFGSSSDLQVGESVIAIGNALGQGNTATAGIVSALSKDVNINGRKLTVIQTDAAINPGNSGGALINSKGQVIGINTAKIAMSTVEGIGYSIASDVAKPIIESLTNAEGTPVLGVTVNDVSEETAKLYGLPQAGVVIEEVQSGSAAEKAGIKVGDIITSFNDTPIFSSEQLINRIKECKVGDSAKVTVIRNNETVTVTAKLTRSNIAF
ncbi:MAG: trypsin-like peptidase domain-containing protein [Firmicutes bacterium]|nr:trypsin-like peptidase domain-containing protein [Bacillota bacterium]